MVPLLTPLPVNEVCYKCGLNLPFLDGDVPRRPSYGVYISQLIRFARVCSHVEVLILVING